MTETIHHQGREYVIDECDGFFDVYRNDADGGQWFLGSFGTADEARTIASLDDGEEIQ